MPKVLSTSNLAKSGYECFFLKLILDELQQGNKEGPIVVINAIDFRCDAIIVSDSEVQAISLSEMNSSYALSFFHQRLKRYCGTRQLKYEQEIEADQGENHHLEPDVKAEVEYFSWLWSNCIQLILKKLKGGQASDSHKLLRVWWIGTDAAYLLSFRAAG